MKLSIKHSLKGLSRRLDQQRKEMPKVITTALNRTAGNAAVAVRRGISQATGIAVGKIKPRMALKKATRSRQIAILTAFAHTPNLVRFASAAAIGASLKRKGKGLKAKAWAKRARVFPGTFVANRGRTVFVRRGKGRLPITNVYGPSIPRSMGSKRVLRHVQEIIVRRWRINFAHEFKRKFERKR